MKYIANIVGWISFPIYLFGLLFAVFWYSGEGNDLAAVFVVLCALPASGLSFLGAMGTYALCSWLVESYGKYANAAHIRFHKLRRGIRSRHLIGAGITGAAVALVLGARFLHQQNRLWNVPLSVLTAQAEGALKLGSSFKECANCPEMVVVASGTFRMGSNFPSATIGLSALQQKPEHQVVIRQRSFSY